MSNTEDHGRIQQDITAQAALPQLSVETLVDSCTLPGSPPDDPADRIIIATARERDLTVLTRDRRILDYSRAGHVRAMAC